MIDHGIGVGLRAIDPANDGGTLFRWRNTDEIRRWTRQNDELTWKRHCEWLDAQGSDPSLKMYVVVANGDCVGVCGLTSIDWQNRRAEFSLYIGPDFQGKGHGDAALRTLLHHAFITLGLNCVWGESFDENPAQAMFAKVGMTKEGTRREFYYRDGKFIGASLWSILRADWDRGILAGVPAGGAPSAGGSVPAADPASAEEPIPARDEGQA